MKIQGFQNIFSEETKYETSDSTLICLLFIVIGIVMLSLSKMAEYNINNHVTRVDDMYHTLDSNQLRSNVESEAEFDFSAIDDISPTDTFLILLISIAI